MELHLLGFPNEEIRPEALCEEAGGQWLERYICEVLPGKYAMMWVGSGAHLHIGFYTDEYVNRNGSMTARNTLQEEVQIDSAIQASALICDFIQRNTNQVTTGDDNEVRSEHGARA